MATDILTYVLDFCRKNTELDSHWSLKQKAIPVWRILALKSRGVTQCKHFLFMCKFLVTLPV